jgi:hypothetical protein
MTAGSEAEFDLTARAYTTRTVCRARRYHITLVGRKLPKGYVLLVSCNNYLVRAAIPVRRFGRKTCLPCLMIDVPRTCGVLVQEVSDRA